MAGNLAAEYSRRSSPATFASTPLCVEDIMSASPITIDAGARLSDAVALMKARNINHLPVMRDGKLVGLLSERHVRDAMPSILMLSDPEARERSLYLTHVNQVCVKDPFTVSPDDPLGVAIAGMRRVRAGSLPVVAQGKLVGILTSGDLITLLEKLLTQS